MQSANKKKSYCKLCFVTKYIQIFVKKFIMVREAKGKPLLGHHVSYLMKKQYLISYIHLIICTLSLSPSTYVIKLIY